MSDYNQTRDAARMITSRFDKTLRNLTDGYEVELLEDQAWIKEDWDWIIK